MGIAACDSSLTYKNEKRIFFTSKDQNIILCGLDREIASLLRLFFLILNLPLFGLDIMSTNCWYT